LEVGRGAPHALVGGRVCERIGVVGCGGGLLYGARRLADQVVMARCSLTGVGLKMSK